jgi:GrpB-like predicted nucleotidyltransferase (UPF0157 family)
LTTQLDIKLTSYTAAWAAAFDAERQALKELAGDIIARIDHIGSTAVPGLDSKPIIDIQAQVAALETPETYGELFGPLGYRALDADEVDVRIPLRKRASVSANLHIVRAGSWAAERSLLFRDALRDDPALARDYTRMKSELATSSESLLVYTLAKTEFVEDVLRRRCEELSIAYSPGNRR